MRNTILEKRVEMQKMKQVNKVYQIIHSQDHLLKLWTKMEGKNSEAVGRVIRKLSAISIRVPLADDVKVYILKTIFQFFIKYESSELLFSVRSIQKFCSLCINGNQP